MADDENEENKQPTLSGVKIDPPDLKFPVTLNKSSKQQLRVSVSSAAENGVTFKIKTTNPKRYSVRPNVGVAWPGADAEVTVQLAALKEPPEAKCKDKFQVLSLPLSAEHSQQLEELADEPHRGRAVFVARARACSWRRLGGELAHSSRATAADVS